MADLDAALRELVRDEVEAALDDALKGVDLEPSPPQPEPEEGWRSKLHRVHEDTRLTLSDVSEALDVSERSVRRYIGGEGEHPPLPHRRGPTGLTVTAGDLRTWISDVEEGSRFRERSA